jgi:hypothetical protein
MEWTPSRLYKELMSKKSYDDMERVDVIGTLRVGGWYMLNKERRDWIEEHVSAGECEIDYYIRVPFVRFANVDDELLFKLTLGGV